MDYDQQRRQLFRVGAALGFGTALSNIANAQVPEATAEQVAATTLHDTPAGTPATLTVERRGNIVLLGINRPSAQNLLDPATSALLSHAYFQFEHDPSLRAAVLFGHGQHFCQGVDVAAWAPVIAAHGDAVAKPETIDLVGKTRPKLSKPVVVAVHGNTWNLGHELHLACDIRIAAANTSFAQTENTHARFPGGGSTIRFVREAGWAQAMRYLLTGDAWTANDALRMGIIQEIMPTADAALQRAIELAQKIAACAPLSIKTTLASAHLALNEGEEAAFAALGPQRSALYATEDFKENLRSIAQHRAPVYLGK